MGKMGERGLFIKERKETIIFFEGQVGVGDGQVNEKKLTFLKIKLIFFGGGGVKKLKI